MRAMIGSETLSKYSSWVEVWRWVRWPALVGLVLHMPLADDGISCSKKRFHAV
jgi:hypothetical protein